MISLSVVPLAKETYDRKDEQNFREWARRNLQSVSSNNAPTAEMQAQLDDLQDQIDTVHALIVGIFFVLGGYSIDFIKYGPIVPPDAAAHGAGERLFNSAPAIGQPKSWICTGSYTWVSEGELGMVSFGTAPPTTGAHIHGERVLNSLPAVGQPKSWACTVAGTPGTWVSEGNL